MAPNNHTPRRRAGDDALRGTKATQRAPEAAFMRPLRSITAYNGWLILEHSEMRAGKLKACFSVQQSTNRPIGAGHSLKEAKQAIDGCSQSPTPGFRLPPQKATIRNAQKAARRAKAHAWHDDLDGDQKRQQGRSRGL